MMKHAAIEHEIGWLQAGIKPEGTPCAELNIHARDALFRSRHLQSGMGDVYGGHLTSTTGHEYCIHAIPAAQLEDSLRAKIRSIKQIHERAHGMIAFPLQPFN